MAWGLKRWIPEWWNKRPVRLSAYSWIAMTLAADACYLGGIELGSFELYQVGKMLWALSIIVSTPMCAALTLCFIVLPTRPMESQDKSEDQDRTNKRRRFLKWAIVPPALAGAASVGGLIRAEAPPVLHEMDVFFPNLPEDLVGLKILHITDAHLGPFIGMDSIDDTVNSLDGQQIDLVAITGDFADHLRLMKPAVERLEKLNATHGIFFSMGNHEYYHPDGKVREHLNALSVRTLVSSGVAVKIKNSTLFVAGADDPAKTEADKETFLLASVEKALKQRPKDAFTLLLCHRPAGFNAAQELGVDLTLAGDTHGYQLGIFGLSPMQYLFGEEFPRGHYQRGTSQLYTSTGLGHWFPFRLGCDREAALIVLRKG